MTTKRFLVAFANMATMPAGIRPPPAARTRGFDDFAAAKGFAERVLGKWNWIAVYDRTLDDGLMRIETYQRGLRYSV